MGEYFFASKSLFNLVKFEIAIAVCAMRVTFVFCLMNLSFPVYEFKIKTSLQKKYIFDEVRKKFILLTPEEWIRQHCIAHLNKYYKQSLGLMQVEKKVVFNNLNLRFDLACYNTKQEITLIVECKRPGITISKETILQAAKYYDTLNPKWIWITNGINHIWIKKNTEGIAFVNEPDLLPSC